MQNKNIPLIIGIALPILFIAIVAVVIFIPSMSVKPQYNFLYSTDGDRYSYGEIYKNSFIVQNGKITKKAVPVPANIGIPKESFVYKGDEPEIYLYDVKENTSRKISFEEAQKLNLDSGPSSPDGYTIKFDYSNNGILEIFGSDGNNSGYFISKGNGVKKLNGLVQNYYWENNFKLIGWIK